MRIGPLLMLVLVAVTSYSCGKSFQSASITPTVTAKELRSVSNSTNKVDFTNDVEPLLRSKCQPCHFSGGKVYEKLPFDRAETIKKLGTKLFTRIHDENERKIINEFLSQ
jgi:hypothetical protein